MEPVCHENTRSNGVPFQNACLIYEAYLACVQILFRIVIWWKPYWWIVWLAALRCIHGKHSRRVGTITQMLRNLSKYLCYLTEHGKSCHQSSILSVNFWVIPTSPRKDLLTLILSKKKNWDLTEMKIPVWTTDYHGQTKRWLRTMVSIYGSRKTSGLKLHLHTLRFEKGALYCSKNGFY